ncbi:hypothetical protein ACFSMW_15180 [Virgibacillus halophilus]|uniref:Phosphotransferase n=1 Tax=Tigheibacillus halophilus TaxID=361280 RepID=A0ABU5CC97_9BACI|nr:phosphotransferase [Virgibacillus halophilus]
MNTNTKRALAGYNLVYNHVEPIGNRLYKISTDAGDFALKKSRLTPATVQIWEQVFRQAYHTGIHTVLPVYLNKDGQLFTLVQDDIYYVQPWLEMNENVHDTRRVLEELAQMHVKTEQKVQLKTEKMKNSLQKYLKFCRKCKEKMEAYITVFENQRYMSPFELLACTQYHQVRASMEVNDSILEDLLEHLDETINWQSSLSHGKLLPEHIYCGKYVYFLNWESASFDSPVADLSVYFGEVSQHYHPDPHSFLEGFAAYMERNELDIVQCQMLLIHLLNPNDYFQLIRSYVDKTSCLSMTSKVQELQHLARPLLFGTALKHFMDEQHAVADSADDSSNPPQLEGNE